jgi:hypothetical protein
MVQGDWYRGIPFARSNVATAKFGLFNQTPDKDRLIALRSGVEYIQRRLSQEFGRQLSWNETLDEVLKHNRDTSQRPYLEMLREEEEEETGLVSKSVM